MGVGDGGPGLRRRAHVPSVRVNVPRPPVFEYSTVNDFPSGVKVTPVRPTAFSPAAGKPNVSPA